MLGGLIYLIILYRSKNQNELSIAQNPEGRLSAVSQVYLEDHKKLKRVKIKKYFSIFLISLIKIVHMIAETLLSKLVYVILDESLEIPIYFSSIVIFTIIILNTKIYRHQYISLFIVVFCFLIILTFNILKYTIDFFDFLKTLLFYIITCGILSFYIVFIKKYFEVYSTNPYYLMFFIGLFNLILLVPIDLLEHLIYFI